MIASKNRPRVFVDDMCLTCIVEMAKLLFGVLIACGLVMPQVQAATLSNLFVSSVGDNSIKEYDGVTEAFIENFVVENSHALTFGPNSNLFISGSSGISEYDGTTGAFITNFVPSSEFSLVSPEALTFGPNGNLFVTTEYSPGLGTSVSSGVDEYNGTTGAFITNFVPISRSNLNIASGLTFGPNGNLFVTTHNFYLYGGSVNEYSGTTGAFITTFASVYNNPLLSPLDPKFGPQPQNLAFGPNGNLFVSNNDGSIKEYDGVTGAFITDFVPSSNRVSLDPLGLTFGPNGNLFVSGTDSSIKEYDGVTGAFITDFVSSNNGGLTKPTYLTFAPTTIPEPSPAPGILAFEALGLGSWLLHQMKKRI